ncbi:MAG: AzlD domain-containing protein [Actinomycetota bacterium]|nr:AzlD domain-containing protein [Actinomycetota bacterium]
MIDHGTLWVVIVTVAAASLLTRASFLLPRLSAELPPAVIEALRMIPPAAFAALVVPALLRPSGAVELLTPESLAGVVAALVAWRTRSIAATIVAGLLAVVAIEQLLEWR